MKLPDLHRVGTVPDWEKVPREEWNEYQTRAAATNGWDTPGNRETLKGALSTLAGLALIYADTPLSNLAGTTAIGYGRWKDIQDGKRADETDTKSPLGETLDASTDAFLMAVTLPVLTKKNIIPKSEASAMASLVAVKSIATCTAKLLGREIHPGRVGKVSSFVEWSGVGMYLISHLARSVEANQASQNTNRAARIVNRSGIALVIVSAAGYVIDASTPKRA